MRLHSLDAARGSLMILGVLFHALVFVYLFQEPASLSEFLAVVFTHQLLHSFRMPAFFMIAGFFALLLIDKRGRNGFLRNRLLRIGLPFLIFWQPMVILNAYSSKMGWYGKVGYPPPADLVPSDDTQHLWFLYFLLIFAVVLWVSGPILKKAIARQFTFPLTPTLLLLAIATPLIPGVIERELTTSTRLAVDPGVLVFYFLTFLIGAVVYIGRERLLPLLARRSIAYVSIGLGFFALFFVSQDWGVPQNPWLYSFAIGLLSPGVIGLFLRFASGENRFVRFLSDGSYWLYLIHLPLVFFFLVIGSEAKLSAIANVTMTTLATLLIAYASYKLFVRSTFIGALLNGRRYPFTAKGEPSTPQ